MRLARSCQRSSTTRLALASAAAAAVCLSAACGGGAAPQATTPPTTTAPSPAAGATPPRPPLASPAPSPSPAVAGKPTAGPEQTYVVQPGDTLLSIAEQVYGDATLWRRIYDANRDVIGANPDALKIDMELKIPPKES